MQAIKESFLYTIYLRLAAWCSLQWGRSAVVRWFISQKPRPSRALGQRLLGLWRSAFHALRLDRLLTGSVFLHPAVFAGAAVVVAPLAPTMVCLGLVCASFFALALRLGARTEDPPGTTPLDPYCVLFAGVYLYAMFTSTTRSGSLFPALLTALFVLFYLALTRCGLEKRVRLLVGLMVLAGVLVTAYGFYQMLFPARFTSAWVDDDMFSDITFRMYSTLENPNVLGEYYLLILPLTGAMVLTAGDWKRRALSGGAFLIMGAGLVLTYSRGCYLGLLFAAAVFLVLLDRRFLVAGLILLALSPLYLPETVLSRFTSIGNLSDSSTSYRVYIWMGTLEMLRDYWFSGIGPGEMAFNTVYPKYAYNAVTAPHSHNLFLQVVCDTGICGLIVLALALVSYYRMMFTAMHRETDRQARMFQIAGVSAVSGFLVQSMTDYTFYNYRVLLLFWAVLGLSVLFTRMGRRREEA